MVGVATSQVEPSFALLSSGLSQVVKAQARLRLVMSLRYQAQARLIENELSAAQARARQINYTIFSERRERGLKNLENRPLNMKANENLFRFNDIGNHSPS